MNPRRIGLGMFVLLAGSFLLVSSGSRPNEFAPSASETGPGGLGALARLLEKDGHRVERDYAKLPVPRPGVTVWSDTDGGLEMAEKDWEKLTAEGGTVVVLGFQRALPSLRSVSPTALTTATGRFGANFVIRETKSDLPLENDSVTLVYANGEPVISVRAVGQGRLVMVHDATMFANRYLDESDHAALALDLFKRTAQGLPVRFAEASAGLGKDEGLLTKIGPWAVAAQWQGLVVFAILVWCLGARFGPLLVERTHQRGVADLSVSLAELWKRSKKLAFCNVILAEHEAEVERRKLRLGPDLTPMQVAARVTGPKGEAMVRSLELDDEQRSDEVLIADARAMTHPKE